MKPIVIPALLLLVSFTACAQSSNLETFLQKYPAVQKQDKGGINISFSGDFGNGDGKSSDDWSRKIKQFHCLTIAAGQAQEWADLNSSLRKDNFESWFSARKGKGRFEVLSTDGRHGLTEVVCLIVNEEGKGTFFHLSGRFSAADKDHIRDAFQDKDADASSN